MGWKLKSWTSGGGRSYLILAFPHFVPALKYFEWFFSADGPHAFDSHNHRHVLEEQSLCLGKTKYHGVCLQKGCHFSAAVWSVSSLLTEPLIKKKNCDRQRWQKYIYFVLKVIRTTFTPSCQGVIRSLVLHYSPLVCKLWGLPSWCSGLSVTSQQEAWVPILMKSILHILKEKHTCSLWALSPKTGKVNPQFSIGIVSLSV